MISKTETPTINVRYRPLTDIVPDGCFTAGLMTIETAYGTNPTNALLDWAHFILDCTPILVSVKDGAFRRAMADWAELRNLPQHLTCRNAIGTFYEQIAQVKQNGKLPVVVFPDLSSSPTYTPYDDHPYTTLRNFATHNGCLVLTVGSGSLPHSHLQADYVFTGLPKTGQWQRSKFRTVSEMPELATITIPEEAYAQ